MKLSRYEQETIINFNAEEKNATLYTRDRKVMKLIDELVSRYPDVYHLDSQTEIDKTYSFSKLCIKYLKPRNLSQAQREQKRKQMKQLTRSITNGRKSS